MNDTDLAALRRLADKEAIRDCVHRFARGLDRHDEGMVRSVFDAAALDNHGDAVVTREEFPKFANEWHANVSTHHFHAITTHFSEIAGDEAHAVTYVLFTLCRKDGKTVHIGGGRYLDRLIRDGDEWRILLRRLVIDWRLNGRTPEHGGRLEAHPRGTWDLTDPSYSHLGGSPG
jgi:hypothetical protein